MLFDAHIINLRVVKLKFQASSLQTLPRSPEKRNVFTVNNRGKLDCFGTVPISFFVRNALDAKINGILARSWKKIDRACYLPARSLV